ncbi:MAG TPA: DNA polymerase III subunit chi [Gammaproteobacteria bacterium]|nr:DNA polymerase III subunit chi [Gammaproteobacteria bacterium]
MTQVDFYVLKAPGPQERLRFACRLVDKAWRLGHRVHVHTGSAPLSHELDTLLWTFAQNSFVPHGLEGEAGDPPPPVLIGHEGEPEPGDVLVNLAGEVPLFFSRFQRVAEIVGGDEQVRAQGRQRYSFYKQRGYPLRSHEIQT